MCTGVFIQHMCVYKEHTQTLHRPQFTTCVCGTHTYPANGNEVADHCKVVLWQLHHCLQQSQCHHLNTISLLVELVTEERGTELDGYTVNSQWR